YFNQAVMLELKPDVNSLLLEQALGALLIHHDALRLCFEQRDGQWFQRNGEATGRVPFSRKDLSDLPESERSSYLQEDPAQAQVQASLNLSEGSLVRAVEYQLSDGERRFLLVIHHLAIDGV